MKQIIVMALSALLGSQAFAGAYGMKCLNKDNSITIRNGTLTLVKENGQKVEGIYFSVVGIQLMFGAEIRDFLGEKNPKFVIEADLDSVGNRSVAKVLSEKLFKDECGHKGSERKLQQNIRIYDDSGSDTILKTDTIFCTEYAVSGHCA